MTIMAASNKLDCAADLPAAGIAAISRPAAPRFLEHVRFDARTGRFRQSRWRYAEDLEPNQPTFARSLPAPVETSADSRRSMT